MDQMKKPNLSIEHPLLSIIIPAYNAEKTISETLGSILALPDKESKVQIIVIDDCSTDKTSYIVQSYVDKYCNVHLLKQEQNHKQGAARNRALKFAMGEYVTFADADDIMLPDLMMAIEEAVTSNVDVLVCKYVRVLKTGKMSIWSPNKQYEGTESGREFFVKYFDESYIGAPWGYLLKREYLKRIDIPFAEDVYTEDIDWVRQHLYYANSIKLSQAIIYQNNYVANSSTTGKKDAFRLASILLEYYRELIFADKIKAEDINTSKRLIKDATYFIDYIIRRLWKAEECNIKQLYSYIGNEKLNYLVQNYKWSIYTKFALKHYKINTILLRIASPILLWIKKVIR